MKDFHRYHRQMLLPGFGEAGQRRLAKARALIVGCGALGTVIADGLARAGVGTVVLVDRDFVELTNLQRQVLFDEQDVAEAKPKAVAARDHLAKVNSGIEVIAEPVDFNQCNAESLASGCDILLDGTDNFETRYLLNDVAVKRGIPYIYAGAVGLHGTLYTVLPPTPTGDAPWETGEEAERPGMCLRCLLGDDPPGGGATCDTVGVLGPVVGIMANQQVIEAMKILTGHFNRVDRRLRSVDLWHNRWLGIEIAERRSEDCVCCAHRRFDYLDGQRGSALTALCGRDAVQVMPTRGDTAPLDLAAVAERLGRVAEVHQTGYTLRAVIDHQGAPRTLTLFKDGRAIVQGTDDPAVARGLYSQYIGL